MVMPFLFIKQWYYYPFFVDIQIIQMLRSKIGVQWVEMEKGFRQIVNRI